MNIGNLIFEVSEAKKLTVTLPRSYSLDTPVTSSQLFDLAKWASHEATRLLNEETRRNALVTSTSQPMEN